MWHPLDKTHSWFMRHWLLLLLLLFCLILIIEALSVLRMTHMQDRWHGHQKMNSDIRTTINGYMLQQIKPSSGNQKKSQTSKRTSKPGEKSTLNSRSTDQSSSQEKIHSRMHKFKNSSEYVIKTVFTIDKTTYDKMKHKRYRI